MWYLFTIFCIILAIISYRLSKKTQKRSLHSQIIGWDKIFGTDATTVCWASVALAFVIGNIVSSNPGRKQLKSIKFQSELRVQQALGQYFADQFGQLLETGSNVLVINHVKGEADQEFHEAFMAGFILGGEKQSLEVEEEVIRLANDHLNDESKFSELLWPTAEQFDKLVDKNKKCSAVISLIGIPDGYESSRTWLKVNNGKMLLGIVSDDVYLLGGMVINEEIAACIVPKRRYTFEKLFSAEDSAEKIFSNRFYYITATNIIEIMREDRRIFKVTRRI